MAKEQKIFRPVAFIICPPHGLVLYLWPVMCDGTLLVTTEPRVGTMPAQAWHLHALWAYLCPEMLMEARRSSRKSHFRSGYCGKKKMQTSKEMQTSKGMRHYAGL